MPQRPKFEAPCPWFCLGVSRKICWAQPLAVCHGFEVIASVLGSMKKFIVNERLAEVALPAEVGWRFFGDLI